MRMLTGVVSRSMRQQGLVWCMAAILGVSLVVGCSGKPAVPAAGEAESEGSEKEPASTTKRSSKPGQGEVVVAAAKRPSIEGIPLDVWFDNPIGESNKKGNVAAPTTPDKPAETAATKPETPKPADPPAETPKAAGKDDWASIISIEDLQEETKQIRIDLQKHLASVQVYNGNYKDNISADGTVLSALAAIALVHPEKVSWKEHAAHVRDIAAEMVKKAKGLGPKPFEETKKEFEKIDGLLSGNPPPDIGEATADIPFSEVISRRGIMKRLQKSSDDLRANFQTEAALGKANENAAHTATIVAAMTKVIGTEGYNNADEDDYIKFVKGLMDANLTMAKAARDKDFTAFSEANGKVGKFCGECHSAYQSN